MREETLTITYYGTDEEIDGLLDELKGLASESNCILQPWSGSNHGPEDKPSAFCQTLRVINNSGFPEEFMVAAMKLNYVYFKCPACHPEV